MKSLPSSREDFCLYRPKSAAFYQKHRWFANKVEFAMLFSPMHDAPEHANMSETHLCRSARQSKYFRLNRQQLHWSIGYRSNRAIGAVQAVQRLCRKAVCWAQQRCLRRCGPRIRTWPFWDLPCQTALPVLLQQASLCDSHIPQIVSTVFLSLAG